MQTKKTAYANGSSAARRPQNAAGHTAPRRAKRKKKYAAPFIVMFALIAVLGGAVLALRQYLGTSPQRPLDADRISGVTEGALPDGVGQSVPADASISNETILPDAPQFTEDGILMTRLENGGWMYERDGITWLVIGGHEMLLCNKEYDLPANYGDGLTRECQQAFDEMAAAAEQAGLSIWVGSGFRSYETQAAIHQNYINTYGVEYTKSVSAEPGHSEHQTGLAIDVAGAGGHYLEQAFDTTAEYDWLAEHAQEYGFILRYQKGKEWATGYIYEPWHYRYVGKDLAALLKDSGVTVEEYVGLAKAEDAAA